MRCPKVCLYICRSCLRVYLKTRFAVRARVNEYTFVCVWVRVRVDACACACVRKAARSRSILLDTKVAMKRAKRRQISHKTTKIAMRARARESVVRRRSSSLFFRPRWFFPRLCPTPHRAFDIRAHWPKLNSVENGYKIRGVRKDEFINPCYNFMREIVYVNNALTYTFRPVEYIKCNFCRIFFSYYIYFSYNCCRK